VFFGFLVFAHSLNAATLSVRIGMIDELLTCSEVQPGQTVHMDPVSSSSPLLLRFVVPDDLEGHTFDIEVTTEDGVTLDHRAGRTSGIGRRSIVLPPLGVSKVAVINRAKELLLLENLKDLAVPQDHVPGFFLALLTDPKGARFENQLAEIDKITTTPGVRKLLGSELHFARDSADVQREQLTKLRAACDRHELGALVSPSSWWGGTPREVWKRPEFQQVCWSKAEAGQSAELLKPLLGDRWTPRYGFTVPNMWANTPWQTMNNTELNTLRAERLRMSIPLVEQELAGRLAGYISENEPAYWAWESNDYRYPVRRSDLWADFNPSTVADAKRYGVELNPEDGLDLRERSWLHDNACRYIQQNVDVLNSCTPTVPVYSHALLDQHFPFQGTGHFRPYGEIGRVNGARTGFELLRKANYDSLWRVRDWGAWACVNREENDGVDMAYHTGMLQLVYAQGADMLQSYNWDSVNEGGRAISYFNEFVRTVSAGRVVVGNSSANGSWRDLETTTPLVQPLLARYTFPWGNDLQLGLRATDTCTSAAVWITQGVSGPVVAYRRVFADQISRQDTTRIALGDLLHVEQDDALVLHLEAREAGWKLQYGNDGVAYEISCDLNRARALSLAMRMLK
jgi:hypothetical protein